MGWLFVFRGAVGSAFPTARLSFPSAASVARAIGGTLSQIEIGIRFLVRFARAFLALLLKELEKSGVSRDR